MCCLEWDKSSYEEKVSKGKSEGPMRLESCF